MARIRNANESAMHAFFNNVDQTIGSLKEIYGPTSENERKDLMKGCQKSAKKMWVSGDWLSALGLSVSALIVEIENIPGEDASFVKAETDKIIAEAAANV